MKKINRKQTIALLIVACLLVSVISAYFTDAETVTNTFTTGEVSLDLQEPSWDPDNAENIVPNQVIEKDPQILNDGTNEEYVFMTVAVPFVEDLVTANADGTKNDPADTELFLYEINEGWVEIGTPVVDGGNVIHTYAYGTDTEMTKLAANVTTPALFDEVTFVNAVEKQQLENTTKEIVINAYGIQTENVNGGKTAPADVWMVIQNQAPTPEE